MKGKDCPAFGKKCSKCHKWNHFAVVSKSQSNRFRKQKPGNGKVKRRVKKTIEAGESTCSVDEFFGQAAEHLSQEKNVKQIGGAGTTGKCVKVKFFFFFFFFFFFNCTTYDTCYMIYTCTYFLHNTCTTLTCTKYDTYYNTITLVKWNYS